MKYITIQKLSKDSGYTINALRAKMTRGVFIQGVHYIHAPDGRIHFNIEAYEQWVIGNRLELKAAA